MTCIYNKKNGNAAINNTTQQSGRKLIRDSLDILLKKGVINQKELKFALKFRMIFYHMHGNVHILSPEYVKIPNRNIFESNNAIDDKLICKYKLAVKLLNDSDCLSAIYSVCAFGMLPKYLITKKLSKLDVVLYDKFKRGLEIIMNVLSY